MSDYGENRRREGLSQQLSASYVTGSHAFKAGFQMMEGIKDHNTYIPQSLTYQFRNNLPSSIIEWQLPATIRPRVRSEALYAQDQWTIKNLTLNYGVRFDAFQGKTLAENLPAGNPSPAMVCPNLTIADGGCREVTITGRFVPARSFPERDNVPNFKDVSPRLGVAYDVFGNGKTAVKASLNRYVGGLSVGLAESVHPELANGAVSSTTRTWNDSFFGAGDPRTGNFVPDCDLNNNALNGECAATANSAFGTTVVNTNRTDDVTTGFGNREYSWMASAGVQHELRPGVAINVSYFRTWFGNFTTTDNILVAPADFDPYCITAPVDSRLPNGGGNQVCGFYDVQKASFGQVSNVITKASNFRNAERRIHQRRRWHQRAVWTRWIPGRRRELRPRSDALRRRRFAADCPGRRGRGRRWRRGVLRYHAAVVGGDASQVERRLPAAMESRGERGLSEPAGNSRLRQLRGAQRDHRTRARAQPRGVRVSDGRLRVDGLRRPGGPRDDVRGPPQSG